VRACVRACGSRGQEQGEEEAEVEGPAQEEQAVTRHGSAGQGGAHEGHGSHVEPR
jgi:hypothetical protein